MKRKPTVAALMVLLGLPLVLAISSRAFGKDPIKEAVARLSRHSREPIRPIPQTIQLDSKKIALGKELFHDKRLSKDHTISCASCHALDAGGVDGQATSVGINGAVGPINAPTVFNSGFNFKQFWDGRAETLEDQVEGPTQAAAEMGSTWEDILQKLKAAPEYVAQFKEVFPDGVQRQNVRDAIAEFERSLFTPNARFDRYLRGEESALHPRELAGYKKFKAYGCVSCHQGVNVGGNMFEALGAMEDYFAARGNVTQADLGRYNVTGKEEDKYVFKVPSLRNVALTAPYFHDGSAKTLDAAVRVMARYQLGRELSEEDIADLVRFLQTLTGQYNGEAL